jgi:hypothetical protein
MNGSAGLASGNSLARNSYTPSEFSLCQPCQPAPMPHFMHNPGVDRYLPAGWLRILHRKLSNQHFWRDA